MRSSISRRALVRALSLGAAAAGLPATQGRAAEPEKLSVKDPAAVALGYVEDTTAVDQKKYPAYVKGSNCENCLQLQGNPGKDYRPCALFPGKLVAIGGWCSGWTAEM